MGKVIRAYKILVKKPEGKRPPGRPRSRWKDIRLDLRETGWEGVDWIHLVQNRGQCPALVLMVMSLRVHKRQGIS
jgi:hypothetical protein